MKPIQTALIIYGLVCVVHLTGIATGLSLLTQVTKPLLILILLTVWIPTTHLRSRFSLNIMIALLCCWLGDVLLMKDGWFVHGLSAFLAGHIFYILAITGITGKILPRPLSGLLVLIYLIVLLLFLFPHLNEMKLPVLVYAIVISIFLLMCLNTFQRLPINIATLFSAGAILFVLSDSILAVNKFVMKIPFSGIWVMTTYCGAQLLLFYASFLYHKSTTSIQ